MKPSITVRYLTTGLLALLLPCAYVQAEDTKGKWQFGFGLSYFATTDYIRSNADLAFTSGEPGPNGVPNLAVGSVDPRPDINLLNQPSVADRFKYDVSASYGLARWLAVELAASYLKSPVGNIEFYKENNTQPLGVPTAEPALPNCGPSGTSTCYSYNLDPLKKDVTNSFLPIGEITEIPIHLSGLVRFRPESPFDPYIGLGVGYIINRLQEGSEFKARSAEVAALRVTTVSEGEITSSSLTRTDKTNFDPLPLAARVRNSFEWHAVGGVDYYVNNHLSFYVDARYTWTAGSVDIRTDDNHQVQFGILDQGQLLLKTRLYAVDDDPNSGPYLWEDTGLHNPNVPPGPGYDLPCSYIDRDGSTRSCAGDRRFETEDKNQNGLMDNDLHLNTITGLAYTAREQTVCYGAAPGTDHVGEDDGCILVYPPGPISGPSERFDDLTFRCLACVGNDQDPNHPERTMRPDTEDRNFNGILDRFLVYGIDICTTAQGVGNPKCGPGNNSTYNPNAATSFVWPENCQASAPTDKSPPRQNEGCPAPFAVPPSTLTTSSSDNVSDVYLIQGGRLRLGGFGLGFGFKFSF